MNITLMNMTLISIGVTDFGYICFQILDGGMWHYYNSTVEVDGFFFLKVYNGHK